jgi:asparagine synthase (glutamine-hydrolysing)
MCGIAGIVTLGELEPSVLARMSSAIEHRGPDGEGFLLTDLGAPLQMTRAPASAPPRRPIVGFAHRRLSIIDLSSGNDQPFVDETGDLAIAFNGEIYNYLELRGELESLGHRFRTSGDTEVALLAYAQWGVECVERFVGMWAIAICDRARRRLVLTRDRFGIKPLYVAHDSRQIVFASEIKGLLASGLVVAAPDEETISRYLVAGRADDRAETFYAGIRQLPAASTAVISLDGGGLGYRPQHYWSLPEATDNTVAPEDAVSPVRDAFEAALRLHLRSDVPVGTCLSGGIDSSGIVCVGEHLRPVAGPTYTHKCFGYLPPERELSERTFMEAVASSCGAELMFAEPTEPEFHESLAEVVGAQDEPFGSASVAAQWFVFRAAAASGVKVMLDGQGADEVFGGYHHYLRLIAQRLLIDRRPRGFIRLARAATESVGEAPYPAWLALAALMPRRLLRSARDTILARAGPSAPASARMRRLAAESRPAGELDGAPEAILRADVESANLPVLLRYEDRNSMAHSIEARVPYLDHRLVELAFTLPLSVRMRGAQPKWVLRAALGDLLPAAVLERRDKIGFRASPSATWSIARSLWPDPSSLGRGRTADWLDAPRVLRLLELAEPKIEDEFALWRAVNLTLWAQRTWP